MRFEKFDIYETPYGDAQVVETGANGKFARLKILIPSAEAKKGGWRGGDKFAAHVNDLVDPPPSSWPLLKAGR